LSAVYETAALPTELRWQIRTQEAGIREQHHNQLSYAGKLGRRKQGLGSSIFIKTYFLSRGILYYLSHWCQ